MNKSLLIGRWTKDLDLNFSPGDGKARTKGTLAVDRKFKSESGQKEADFITVTVFGKLAENIANYCGKKGDQICIFGRIQTGSYTNKEGQKVYTTEVIADDCQFLNPKQSGRGEEQVPAGGNSFNPDEYGVSIDDGEIPF